MIPLLVFLAGMDKCIRDIRINRLPTITGPARRFSFYAFRVPVLAHPRQGHLARIRRTRTFNCLAPGLEPVAAIRIKNSCSGTSTATLDSIHFRGSARNTFQQQTCSCRWTAIHRLPTLRDNERSRFHYRSTSSRYSDDIDSTAIRKTGIRKDGCHIINRR